jgi:glycogen phosphorylase
MLYQGADLWLNTPRRPYEACGTSGEKAVLNGGLHCSTLDGWWDEHYDGENGFAIGARRDGLDSDQQDAADAQSLFDLLERTIAPKFYDRENARMPRGWLSMVQRSLVTLAPKVLATRMVREYATQLYVPVARHAARLEAEGHLRARALAEWKRGVAKGWGEVGVDHLDGQPGVAELGDERTVEAVVRLGALAPEDVRVELLHGSVDADGALTDPVMQPLEPAGEDAAGRRRYRGSFRCEVSGEYGLTVRVVPAHPDLFHWADAGLVAWANGTGGGEA